MSIKISTIVDEAIWKDFKKHSEESHQSISHLMNQAIKDFLRKRRMRPVFLREIKKSVDENEKLGELLAK